MSSFSGDRREGINTAVTIDVQTVFKGKTYSQLQALHLNIETKIRAGGSNLDVGYWESLLQQVRVYMSRARCERGGASLVFMLFSSFIFEVHHLASRQWRSVCVCV